MSRSWIPEWFCMSITSLHKARALTGTLQQASLIREQNYTSVSRGTFDTDSRGGDAQGMNVHWHGPRAKSVIP